MPNLTFLKNFPTKIICIGLNYKDHARELNFKIPSEPLIFLKPTTALIGPDDYIILPKMSKRVEYEGELGIVIKNKIKNIKESGVIGNLEGFICVNDVTARDLQFKDGQWARAKSFDTFCAVGPKIVAGIEPNNLKIQTFLNGKLMQNSNTKNFIFKVEKVVSFISQVMTLNPGDIITTGTPSGVSKLKKGDKVEVVIEHIGRLRNYVG